MCLLSLNNSSKQCSHSECQGSGSNAYNQYARGGLSGVLLPEDKKRPPIQSISEILAENILKKLKDDGNSCIHNQVEKGRFDGNFLKSVGLNEEKRNGAFYESTALQVSPEAFYFQNQILLLMGHQAQLITETSKSLDKAVMQVKILQSEMVKTKEVFSQNMKKMSQNKAKPRSELETKSCCVSPLLIVPKPGKTINKDQLLTQLYGINKDFRYELKLNSELDTTFYRERNFRFSVALYDLENKKVANLNRIPLSLALYTSENLPKIIETNTIGIPILKGSVEKDLVNGVAEFEKLQIKEVTSHFRNGWVFFMVYAKMPSIFAKNPKTAADKQISGGVEIDFLDIKPLILENVMVKAKKMKNRKDLKVVDEKEGSEVNEESNSNGNVEEDELVLSEKD